MASTDPAPATNIATPAPVAPPSPPPDSLPTQTLNTVKNLLGLNKPKPTGPLLPTTERDLEHSDSASNTLAPPSKPDGGASIKSTTSVQSAPYVSNPVPTSDRADKPPSLPLSPSRPMTAISPPLSPSSPRFSTTASTASESQIFERSVQEPPSQSNTSSTAIPTHITTEDYIPPVLEASCAAITDSTLDPDEVEIVTKVGHVPLVVAGGTGAASVSSAGLGVGSKGGSRSQSPEPHHHEERRAGGGVYGHTDDHEHDKRRLSFISFADVVQSEQTAPPFPSSPPRSSSPNSPRSGRSQSPVSQRTPPSPQQKAAGGMLPPIPNISDTLGSIGEALGLRGRSPSPVGSGPGERGIGEKRMGGEGEDEQVESLGEALRKSEVGTGRDF
ncbi:hypothetical protein BJ508DRAFT_179480 [Ascobolus immersus RN42]|uniref:Uncharacterized protein n=1 Tax=Ascobolus immersus RN42 TaxID=1160509 RepID=A0A3N4HV59_ASCIM|nr:hypothetical protein BJ508DRAFT_179480 [Ascobolus immersus RN42]